VERRFTPGSPCNPPRLKKKAYSLTIRLGEMVSKMKGGEKMANNDRIYLGSSIDHLPQDLVIEDAKCPHCGAGEMIMLVVDKEYLGDVWQFERKKFTSDYKYFKYWLERTFCHSCGKDIDISQFKYHWKK